MNVYAKATPLKGVKGRVDYIASDKRQEHLVAVYGVTDRSFWRELSAHCQKAAAEAGHSKACEGREWHGALPNEYAEMYQGREEELAKEISDMIQEITGTDNVVALHWNKSMSNFHFHAVCSENPEINEVSYGEVLTRNTYFNAEGKRSPKKDCVDPETKELLPGCEMIPKGERKKTIKRFGAKVDLKDERVTDSIKEALAAKFNRDLQVENYKKFEDDGMHIPQQHVGKELPADKQEAVRAKNRLIASWNEAVDTCLEESPKLSSEDALEAQRIIKGQRKKVKAFANKNSSGKWLAAIEVATANVMKIVAFVMSKLHERRNEGYAEYLQMQREQQQAEAQPKFSPLDYRIRNIQEQQSQDVAAPSRPKEKDPFERF